MALKTYLERLGITPKKASTEDGGEYSSSCPGCGDGGKGRVSDRFRTWPNKENKGGKCQGRYWCRRCDISGDTIEFLMKFHNMSFPEACHELGITLPNNNGNFKRRAYQPTPTLPEQSAGWVPKNYGCPSPLWQEKGGNLLANSQETLNGSAEYKSWLAKRGITEAMIRTYGLGYNISSKGKDRYRPRKVWGLPPKMHQGKDKKLWMPQGWIIPAFNADGDLIQLRVRRRDEDIATFGAEIKYFPLDGSSMATMIIHPEAEVFVTVECGFDAILVAALMEGKVGTITTWNSSARPDVHVDKILRKSLLIINLLDFDKGGDDQQAWWANQYKQNIRPTSPVGWSDPGEAIEQGVDLRAWLIDQLPRGLKIKLGFEGGPGKTATPTPIKNEKVETAKKGTVEEVDDRPAVIEMVLSNGFVIKLTDDQREYNKLKAAGEPVFNRFEIAELSAATAKMNDEDRIAAAMKVIEAKTIFCGEITRGEALEEGEEGDDELFL